MVIAYILFPLSYGIFFPGFAFIALFPGVIHKSIYVKLWLDIIYLIVFGAWIALVFHTFDKPDTYKVHFFRRLLLFIIFAVLVVGMISCVRQLV